jgi:hypothetical protein
MQEDIHVQELSPPSFGPAVAIAGVLAWALIVGAGFLWLTEFKTTGGEQQEAPRLWPAESSLRRSKGANTLVVFLHPKCVCSRATLGELAVIMNSAKNLAALVVYAPIDGAPLESEESWKTAKSIPGTTLVVDRDGAEARRFGGYTSGQVVLYDAAGRLQFAGGITGSRGHAGDNVGRRAVQDILAGKPTRWQRHAVFGCALGNRGGA